MEASALPRAAAPPLVRPSVAIPLLRLRGDEQLVALFRSGSEEAFRAIHDRYRARLLAYCRQMLAGSSVDAEDALQDVFMRAYGAMRASARPIVLRPWLYRIAHNRCIDELRRPRAVADELLASELAAPEGPRHADPSARAQQRDDLVRLLRDVQGLPEQQRSVLLMRELQGLSYEELAQAHRTSVPAIKSLLLRARSGLLEASTARETPCAEIRDSLLCAHEQGVRADGRARRHMRECPGCAAYRKSLKDMRRRIAALVPAGPLGLLGLSGSGAGAGGGLAALGISGAGGGAATALSSMACAKVAVLVGCAALLGTANSELRHVGPARRAAPVHLQHATHAASLAVAPPLRRAGPAPTPRAAWRSPRQTHHVQQRAGRSRHRSSLVGPLTGQDVLPPVGESPAAGTPAPVAAEAPAMTRVQPLPEKTAAGTTTTNTTTSQTTAAQPAAATPTTGSAASPG